MLVVFLKGTNNDGFSKAVALRPAMEVDKDDPNLNRNSEEEAQAYSIAAGRRMRWDEGRGRWTSPSHLLLVPKSRKSASD